jgi:hypothetical protein
MAPARDRRAMSAFSSAGRRALEANVARPRDGQPYRRVQALLWLAKGERPTSVARRPRVHWDTIYAWAKSSRERAPQCVPARVRDGAEGRNGLGDGTAGGGAHHR